MSDMVVVHQFAQDLPAPDPYGEAAWRALQPTGQTSHDVARAIERVEQAQAAVAYSIAYLDGERRTALLRGTAQSVSLVDAKLAKARAWQERLNALAEALPGEHTAALAREAAAARVQADLTAVAEERIARFNGWVQKHYSPAARIIAEGLELERLAEAALQDLANTSGTHAAHVVRATKRVAHTSIGNPRSTPTTFRHMVRLPNAEPGEPVAWPPGETHPDFRPNTNRYG